MKPHIILSHGLESPPARATELRLVDDDHRLSAHVEYVAQAFAQFLRAL